ncbi:hypothetical protein IJ579_05275 [bacterium]|nr:hypothetical protein [bacterium]
MKVSQVEQNYASNASGRKVAKNYNNFSYTAPYSASFKGVNLSQTEEMFLNLFPKKEANLYRFMKKVQDFVKGEMGGIAITAIGTGFVAPFPIAFNPFAKPKKDATEEEKLDHKRTLAYSAWRQPVSAVLAAIFQLGVQPMLDKFLENITNDPGNSKFFDGTVYNQAFLNDDKYLERQIKKQFKNGSLKLEDIQIPEGEGTRTAANIEEAVAFLKKERANEQVNEIIKALRGIKDGDKIKIGEHTISTEAMAEAVNYKIEDYINFARDLQKDEARAIPRYVTRGKDLVDNETILREILSRETLEREVAKLPNGELDPKALKEYILKTRTAYENKNSGVVRILDHILSKSEKVMESSCARNLERIDKVKKACGGVFDMNKYYDYMIKRNQIISDKIAELLSLRITDIKSATPELIKARIEALIGACHYDIKDSRLRQIFNDKGVFLSNKDTLDRKIYKDIVAGYKEVAKNSFGTFKQLSKISVGVLVTLPITCTALNWVYPRFMELCFPKLAGVKKNQSVQIEDGGVE